MTLRADLLGVPIRRHAVERRARPSVDVGLRRRLDERMEVSLIDGGTEIWTIDGHAAPHADLIHPDQRESLREPRRQDGDQPRQKFNGGAAGSTELEDHDRRVIHFSQIHPRIPKPNRFRAVRFIDGHYERPQLERRRLRIKREPFITAAPDDRQTKQQSLHSHRGVRYARGMSDSTWMQQTIAIEGGGRGLRDITTPIEDVVRKADVAIGLCHVFVMHTSASLLIQENADPDVLIDLNGWFERAVIDGDPVFRHRAEGPDDMSAHIRSALTQTSLTIPITEGRLGLGTWQGIYLFEHRKARMQRRITITLNGTTHLPKSR